MRSPYKLALVTLCLVLAALISLEWLVLRPAGGTATIPSAPTGLAVAAATEDSVTLVWDPSPPGDFRVIASRANTVTVGWAALPGETFDVTRDGVVVASGISVPEWQFGGLRKTTTFRVCVVASDLGRVSAPGCGTIART